MSIAFSDVETNDFTLSKDPFEQFGMWFDEVLRSEEKEPTAMSLATASLSCKPSVRIVLLKHFDDKGLVFFTNYESEKAKEIDLNPYVAAVFLWPEVNRQIRVAGTISKISITESDKYFRSRTKEKKIGAWASPQSKIISSRKKLMENYCEIEKKYNGQDIPRPPNWGGYRIKPDRFEFWQGDENRLHDRFLYVLLKPGSWQSHRLAP